MKKFLIKNLNNESSETGSNYKHHIESITIDGIPRFVNIEDNYSENFGYQWNKWHSILSDKRHPNNSGKKYDTIVKRTKFDKLETKDKTILECGCGGGDDTEVLLKFPFSEIHAFDLSNAVDRAAKFLKDPRLVFSQASIFDIPYEDESFDFVYCHRVLQHTPDPEKALKSIMSKVKPGGVLFVHSYHKSKNYMRHFKYKYRFITKRISVKKIEWFLDKYANTMHNLIEKMNQNRFLKKMAYAFIPLEYTQSFGNFSRAEIIELEKLVTFDALTPAYDKPMTWETMKNMVESENFEILFSNPNPSGSPIYLTARKII
ncbi:MAG: class I SAM-dependent methyltransferase [Cytophagales bacterium]